MTLAQKHCIPCHTKGIKPLPKNLARKMLKELRSGWRIGSDGKWLRKSYKFSNFTKALAFTNRIGEAAEAEGHHPDLELGWGYVHVSLQTHSVGGLHQNDFVLASKIDEIQ